MDDGSVGPLDASDSRGAVALPCHCYHRVYWLAIRKGELIFKIKTWYDLF